MSLFTNFLNLFKWDVKTDGEEEFDIDKALNDNWDKIDAKYGNLNSTVSGHMDDMGNPHSVTKEQLGLENALLEDSDLKDNTVTFVTSTNRTNIESTNTLAVMFGKIQKYFSDLKTVAFTRKL